MHSLEKKNSKPLLLLYKIRNTFNAIKNSWINEFSFKNTRNDLFLEIPNNRLHNTDKYIFHK
jgi:hypothetical protein